MIVRVFVCSTVFQGTYFQPPEDTLTKPLSSAALQCCDREEKRRGQGAVAAGPLYKLLICTHSGSVSVHVLRHDPQALTPEDRCCGWAGLGKAPDAVLLHCCKQIDCFTVCLMSLLAALLSAGI